MDSFNDLILLKIFSYLPIKSLLNLKPTCKKWSCLIKETINVRKSRIETILVKLQLKHTYLNLSIAERFNISINYEINHLSLVPYFAIIFANENMLTFFNDLQFEQNLNKNEPKRRRVDNQEINIKYLKKLMNLPNGLLSFTSEIIGTDILNSKTTEPYRGENELLSAILFPYSAHFKIIMTNNLEQLKQETSCLFVNHIFLIAKNWRSIKLDCLKYFKCSISGGLVRSSHKLTQSNQEYPKNYIALVTQENKMNIKIAQIVLPEGDSDELANEKFTRLKQSGILSDEANRTIFGFQITCWGRNSRYVIEEHRDTGMFRKYFPNIKLTGFYANGEMGFDYLPDYNQQEPDLTPNLDDLKLLCYTSIFTIVSIKI